MEEEKEIDCPYCGESIVILVDASVERQSYIEDCSVCCKPIQLHVVCADGAVKSVNAERG